MRYEVIESRRWENALRETVYRDRANGRWEYWTHSDGERVKISKSIFDKMVRQGAKIVDA